MIIVDTSVWVDHLRDRDPKLIRLIADDDVALHPFVFGELLLGGLPIDSEVGQILLELASPPIGSAEEAASLIVRSQLNGTGIGYVDAHLLLSARLASKGAILTRDHRLQAQAERLGVAHQP